MLAEGGVAMGVLGDWEDGEKWMISDLCLHVGSEVCRSESSGPAPGGLMRRREWDQQDIMPDVCKETPRP